MILMRDMPVLTYETIKEMEDMTWFISARIFDDLIIVSQKQTCSYILRTAEGLVLFDAIWPDERAYEAIKGAAAEHGFTENFTKLFITHGHIDHVGCARWFVENDEVITYMSKEDEGLEGFKASVNIADSDIFGDIRVLATSGHTAGCMSFIFPVHEGGEKHMAALFGGATPPWGDEEGKQKQLEAVDIFQASVKEYNVDVVLTNHTAFDNGIERIAYGRTRMSHMPNIYILGKEGAVRFCEVFRRVASR